MKKLSIILALFFVCGSAFAKDYAVEQGDGKITILTYVEGSKDSLQDVLKNTGLEGKPIIQIDKSKLPAREDRGFWKKDGNTIVVDQVKKQAAIDKALQAKAAKDAVLLKLKISEEELEKLKI